MKFLLRVLANLFVRRPARSIEEQYITQAVDVQDLQVRLVVLERARPSDKWDRHAPGRCTLPEAYIGRKRWPNARLTFSGRCRPRTLRL